MACDRINSLFTCDTVYSADSVEWLPSVKQSCLETLGHNVAKKAELGTFVCGTYQLIDPVTKEFIVPKGNDNVTEENNDTLDQKMGSNNLSSDKAVRDGNIQVFNCSKKEPYVTHVQTIKTPASLDLKWSFQPFKTQGAEFHTLGQADAEGQLSLYSWDSVNSELKLQASHAFKRIDGVDSEILALSLDWSNKLYSSDPFVAVSFSDGTLATVKASVNQDGFFQLTPSLRWVAHEFEAWIAANNYWNPNVVYSGGDDSKFKGWDLRLISEYDAAPAWTNKSHMMGVCSIQASHIREHIVATGSYDETLRIFDTRNCKAPIQEIDIGGGIWRVRWHPSNPSQLLLAAMHNGFHIVDLDQGDKIQRSFEEHESLAYGADWCQTPPYDLAASCSFYDHKLCLWKTN